MIHKCQISLGSNTDAEAHFKLAHTLLEEAFPQAFTWEAPRWTEPVNFPLNPALFLNQDGLLMTTLPAEEVRKKFKEIERLCGRTPDDKGQGIVRMDIDLMTFDGERLK